jgi:FMN reductase (NADPH)
MNATIDLLLRHRSIRRYTADPVSRETVENIVAAGQRASTSSNLQVYSAIAVTDGEKRVELARLCGNQGHIAQAPVFIAWCADLSKLDRACQLRGLPHETGYVENFLVAAVDVALVMQNAAIAAESLGLGMCYIGGIRNKASEVVALLEMPRLMFPISGMTLGVPDASPMLRPRLPQRAVLHWEKYARVDEDEALLAYDRDMIETGIYEGRQVPNPARPGEMEAYGWLEHSARRVTEPTRPGLRAAIEAQGFALR